MAHVHIKWKSVVGAVCLLLLILIILFYEFSFRVTSVTQGGSDSPKEVPRDDLARTCEEDEFSFQSADVSELRKYCNYYHLPVTGQEGDVLSSSDGTFVLQSVHVVTRHGDRSALHTVPTVVNQRFRCHFREELRSRWPVAEQYVTDLAQRGMRSANMSYAGVNLYPDSKFCDIGSLTPEGALQHVQLGMFLREKYIDKHQLFPSHADDFNGQILVRATNLTRTFQSAVALMYGFERRLDMSRFPGVERADNCTMCTRDTGHQCHCDFIGSRYLDSFAPSFGQTSQDIRSLPGAHRVASNLGFTYAQLPKLSHVFDVSMTHFCHDMTPNCLGASLARDVFDVLKESGRRSLADGQYRQVCRLKFQPLLYEIAHRMKSDASSYRFVLYSGHDSTVEPLANALGVSDGHWPRYASRLIFELFLKREVVSSDRKYYIRVLYNGKDVTDSVSFCRGRLDETAYGLCPLERFVEFVNEGRYDGSPGRTGYDRECRKFHGSEDNTMK